MWQPYTEAYYFVLCQSFVQIMIVYLLFTICTYIAISYLNQCPSCTNKIRSIDITVHLCSNKAVIKCSYIIHWAETVIKLTAVEVVAALMGDILMVLYSFS